MYRETSKQENEIWEYSTSVSCVLGAECVIKRGQGCEGVCASHTTWRRGCSGPVERMKWGKCEDMTAGARKWMQWEEPRRAVRWAREAVMGTGDPGSAGAAAGGGSEPGAAGPGPAGASRAAPALATGPAWRWGRGGPGRAAVATETGPPRPARRGAARSGRTRRLVPRERGRGGAAPRVGCSAAAIGGHGGRTAAVVPQLVLRSFRRGTRAPYVLFSLWGPAVFLRRCATKCSVRCPRDPSLVLCYRVLPLLPLSEGPERCRPPCDPLFGLWAPPGLHVLLEPASPCSRFSRHCFPLPPFHYVFLSLSALKVYKALVLWRTRSLACQRHCPPPSLWLVPSCVCSGDAVSALLMVRCPLSTFLVTLEYALISQSLGQLFLPTIPCLLLTQSLLPAVRLSVLQCGKARHPSVLFPQHSPPWALVEMRPCSAPDIPGFSWMVLVLSLSLSFCYSLSILRRSYEVRCICWFMRLTLLLR